MNKTVIRPTLREILSLFLWVFFAVSLAFSVYPISRRTNVHGNLHSGYVISETWSPGFFEICMLLTAFIVLVIAVELFARSVTVDGKFISCGSPLGIFRQKIKRSEISDFRLSQGAPGHFRLELRVNGRWIVFRGNSRFKDHHPEYLTTGMS